MILNWLIILLSVSVLVFPRADTDDLDSWAEGSPPEVTIHGRYDVIGDGNIALIGSASSVEFTVQGDSVVLFVQSEYESGNSLVITINDLYQGRYLLRDSQVRDIRIGLSRGELSKIGIFKATEAATGNLIIRSIEPNGPLGKVPARSKTIEFIGNSITCGAAADTQTIPCGTGYYHDQHNAYLAYGPQQR